MDGMSWRDSTRRYTREEAETWRLLLARHMDAVQQAACAPYLAGLSVLAPLIGDIDDLPNLNERIAPHTEWRLVPDGGMAPITRFFRDLADNLFPCIYRLRPRAEVDFALAPDMFHDVLGHVPALLDPRTAAIYRLFGDVARDAGYAPQTLGRLRAVFYAALEIGLVEEDGDIRVLGGAILSSREETRNIFRDRQQIVPFDLDDVLATDFNTLQTQPRYFLLRSVAHIAEVLEQLRPRDRVAA